MATKRSLINQAFEELGVAAYVFDLAPEQITSAHTRLTAMLLGWNGQGIRLGYDASDDIDGDAGVPDYANEAIYTNLAVRLAPTIGKQASAETLKAAKLAYNLLLQRAAMPEEMQLNSSIPAGAGHKYWRDAGDPFLRPPSDPVNVGPDGPLEF